MIQAIRPTSKASLKMQCMLICQGDVAKAKELYDFYIQDMDELPMFDPQTPTTMQQVKESAVQTVTWINENKDNILDWIGLIRGMFSKTPAPPSAPIPPIN